MSWNTKNDKERVYIGNARRMYKLSMGWAWIRKYHPKIADALAEESVRKFPFLIRRKNSQSETLEGLKRIEAAR